MSKKFKKNKIFCGDTSYKIKDGVIIVKKGINIDLNPRVNETVQNAVISKLDNIISQENVIIDSNESKVNIETSLLNELQVAEIKSRNDNVNDYTIIMPIYKKKLIEDRDINLVFSPDIIGAIYRTTTLPYVFSNNKFDDIDKLCLNDESNCTDVIYLPKLLEFIDFKKGKARKSGSFTFNLLLVALPTKNIMIDDIIDDDSDSDEIDYNQLYSRIIADTCDAAIRCGCKNIIISPYGHKILSKDTTEVAKLWKKISTSQRFIDNFDNVVFTIENENDHTTFDAYFKDK